MYQLDQNPGMECRMTSLGVQFALELFFKQTFQYIDEVVHLDAYNNARVASYKFEDQLGSSFNS